MAKQIKTIDYDEDNDDLFISVGEKVKASLDIGDFILDVSHGNLICGIEVMNASENLGVDKDILSKIKSMKMSVNYKTNHVYVLLVISFKKGDKEVNMPIPLTLDLGHKVPKQDILLYN
jgi:uncharacterized protein YuzE